MIKSLSEYLNEIERNVYPLTHGFNNTTLPWFRGQSNEAWELVPSIYRNNGNSEYEREMVRDFKLNANLKIHRLTDSNLEILFLMQHYGIPTLSNATLWNSYSSFGLE